MSGVFQNIDPSPPGECVSLAVGVGEDLRPTYIYQWGGHTRWVERGWGWGVNSSRRKRVYI
jgi:hypothetical protein